MTSLSKSQLRDFLATLPLDPIADIGGASDGGLWAEMGREAKLFDLRDGYDICKSPLPGRWPTIVSLDTFEHIFEPHAAAQHIGLSLARAGRLFLTTVSAWPDHKHPVDTFRYMEDGLRYLFRALDIERVWSEPDDSGTRITVIARKPSGAPD